MPQGDKSAYTDKQKRKAEHIEESYEKRGASKDEAERRAWATVNKESGGGNKSGGTWQAGHQGFFTRRQEKRRRGFRGPKRRRPVGGGQERLGNATQRWQALSWRVLKNSVTPKPGLRRRGGGEIRIREIRRIPTTRSSRQAFRARPRPPGSCLRR